MPDTTPPRWVALSWRLRESSPATDGLSIGRIVQAGIEIADEHGLGGLSLRKLGEQLGAGTMAAYRHMRSKEELIHLMVDVAFETGLDIQHLLDAALFVDGHVRHVAYLRRELRARTSLSPQVMPPWLSTLLDDGSFPMARRVFEAGLLEDGDEQDMEHGLDWIIAGIEAHSHAADEALSETV